MFGIPDTTLLHVAGAATVFSLTAGPAVTAIGAIKHNHGITEGGLVTTGAGMISFGVIGKISDYWPKWFEDHFTSNDYTAVQIGGGALVALGVALGIRDVLRGRHERRE